MPSTVVSFRYPCLIPLLALRLQNHGLSKKLGVLNEEGIEMPATGGIPIRNAK